MAGISIWGYPHYKLYLNALIDIHERGYKSKLAKAIHCDLGYVSRVLNGDAHFSLEQADALNSFLVHSPSEGSFFIALVSQDRAGTPSLKKYYESQIKTLLQQKLDIKNRVQPSRVLSETDQARYYSSWHYSAVHLMLAIPAFQTADAIQASLQINTARIHEILGFLVSIGLAKQNGKRFLIAPQTIHLGKDSPFVAQHHTNWRLKAIDSLAQEAHECATHYSSVVSIGKKDLPVVQEKIIQAIESIRKTVRDSEDETVWCYGFDWFPVIPARSGF